ncbi:uncharacterized protein LOC133844634 [Drosophila sulfurigaster albostrigata]|uniref:uncharacterized protein LOC133844634 n=1 Tax=Drosophila sulfurigaster albostrigata TaxID=89887 RepID=UPI002D21BBFF|nr:uncharacterized protein LOC133844634 [Drosophila sulfurigaster albostrigata]
MHSLTLALIAICGLSVGFAAAPAPAAAAAPANNFYLEVQNWVRSVPHKEIQQLVRAYALNDAGFQSVLREINSLPTYRLRQQVLRQPEVLQLIQWLGQQLLLSGGSLKVFDDLEIEIKLFNKYPYWAQSVNGVAGFEQEFLYLYPVQQLRSLLESNAQQSPASAELWRRLVALKPVYERIVATPQAIAFGNRLRALGVDIAGVDSLIRYQLGWSNETVSNYDYQDYLGF